ncbi:motile sperm domain-containing protein 2 isoform X2 [Lagenorhynchus albirostris]|uniref:motile sperm domain-containing protein 2 isoform X2 n=1 Tax=Lagenorhynchus albirostris TaxID=27610 RepID=UPI0028E44A82|nr:motile sperm domain-containing protein 2 isoform X2 [Lagenorhynchus albirostris]
MAECQAQNKAKLISDVRRRFEAEYVTDKSDKYDLRDVERLQQDDNWVESYLCWRHNVVDETLKMLDESFQWRKEMSVNDLTEASIPRWLLEIGGIYLHGYDKEGNKLFWIRVKYHIKDQKTIMDKKKLIAFWLERYAKRENGKPVTVMFDLSETGINSIDMDFVRFIINCFKVYYPKYLSKMVIFDMPWIMNAAFKIVKSWLGPEAVSLLKFTSKNDVQDYVSVEYLPLHMGGTVNIIEPTFKAEENEKVDSKMKAFKKPLSVFKGALLNISPAEELYFGSTESEEKKALITLTNVTKNIVAFKVRTTAPEKYRVKPSNSSCDPGASVDIVVSPHGGLTVSAQDRFLIMAAEMEQSSGTGPAELTQFWKEVPRNKVMEHRLRCHIVESIKPTTLTLKHHAFNMSDKTSEELYLQLNRLLESNRKLEDQVQHCIWFQQWLLSLTVVSLAFVISLFYLLYS